MERLDVAVVGAGVSGLAAARELGRQGLRVAVFECSRPARASSIRSGRPSAELTGRKPEEIAGSAFRALAEQLGISRRRVESRAEGFWLHDWNADPLSRGAYSYARVGGSKAAKALSKPVEGTLFFAGEATDAEGRTGTVEGAIATGLRAAKQIGRRGR